MINEKNNSMGGQVINYSPKKLAHNSFFPFQLKLTICVLVHKSLGFFSNSLLEYLVCVFAVVFTNFTFNEGT